MPLSTQSLKPGVVSLAGIALAGSFAGCGNFSAPWAASGQPTVVLPLAAAGGVDDRLTFAGQFAHELTTAGQKADMAAWLHPLPHSASRIAPPIAKAPSLTSVLVVPGIFGECLDGQALPFSDGVTRPRPLNYVEGYQHYAAHLGAVRAVRVGGRASSEANGKIVARAIQEEAARADIETIIVVAYSKGLADTLMALQHLQSRDELPSKLKAVVSISGVVLGTPVADKFGGLYTKLLQSFSPLECPKSLGGEVESLTVGTRTAWLATTPLPSQIATFSVVAYAAREEVAPALQPFFDVLSRVDPLNDGQVYAAWSVLPRAHLLAEVRSDHWTYVLALERNEDLLPQVVSSGRTFPREAFFRAVIKTVAARITR